MLCLAFIGLKIAVGAIAKSSNGKAKKDPADKVPLPDAEATENKTAETVTISRAEYEELLRIKDAYERMNK